MTFPWLPEYFAPESTPPTDVSLTGTINDLPTTDGFGARVSALRFTGAAPTIAGLVTSPDVDGQRIHLMAVGGQLIIADEALTSSAVNRIKTGVGANVTVGQDGTAWLVYDETAQRWRLSNGAAAGAIPPTGTGIPHIVGGVPNASASLIVNADVALGAAIALSKVAAPTGTGLRHVVAGVEPGAATLLVNADVDPAAAIAASKLAPPGASGQLLWNSGSAFAAAPFVTTDGSTLLGLGSAALFTNSNFQIGVAPGGLIVSPDLNGLRLSVTSGQPLPTADVATASTIYLTPYRSGSIALYSAATIAANLWFRRDTAEVSLALSGLTAGKNYDVFAYWTGTVVALELGPAWTGDTARATALVLQDGVYVKSGSASRRYVGTIRAISATATTDTQTQRFVYNEYNQFRRHLLSTDATTSWPYGLTTFRQANGNAANKVEVVVGNPAEIEASATALGTAGASGIRPVAGIGIDSTTVNSGISFGDASSTAFASETNQSYCEYAGVLGAGYHAINRLEAVGTASSETFYGTGGGSTSYLRAMMRL